MLTNSAKQLQKRQHGDTDEKWNVRMIREMSNGNTKTGIRKDNTESRMGKRVGMREGRREGTRESVQ
jgi:hypothetical protein